MTAPQPADLAAEVAAAPEGMFVRCRNDELDLEAELLAKAVPIERLKGWTPISEPRSRGQADHEAGVAEHEAELARRSAAAAAIAAVEGGSRADVLEVVGADPDAARAALEAERAKDKPRSTLTDQLEQIAEPGPGDDVTRES